MCRSASSLRAVASKVRMNSRPMILRFCSGSVTPGQRAEELVLGVDDLQPGPGRRDEVLLDLVGLTGALQAVVDVHAGQLVADRLVHQGRRDRGVDAAGQRAEHLLVADLLADQLDLLVDHVRWWSSRRCSRRCRRGSARAPPARPASAAPPGATAHRRAAARRPRTPPPARPPRRPVRRTRPAGRAPRRRATSTRSGPRGCRRAACPRSLTVTGGPAELAQPGPPDLAAERLRHRLEPVADPERRHAGLEQRRSRPAARPRRTPTAVRRTG